MECIGLPLSDEVEGAYRRGFHQAVAFVAESMKEGHKIITPEDLESWVNGRGMKWRKDSSLAVMLLPPLF